MTNKIALVAVLALSVIAAVSPVQAAFILNFDEKGNGSISRNGGPATPVIGALTPNPSCASVTGGLCLTYLLGELVVNGDVAISDSAAAFVLGDGLRFTDANGTLTGQTADRMIYFSDIEQGPNDGDLADTGFPVNFDTSFVGATEVGPEGSNRFTFTANPNVYNGISDTPEPATVFLLGFGALALSVMRRSRPIT